MKKPLFGVVVMVVLISGVLYIVTGRKRETYRDKYVQAGHLESPFSAFFAHLPVKTYLTVNGKTYSGIRGFEPYYIVVPEMNSILFVTVQKSHTKFHVVNLKTKREFDFEGDESGFGSNIGSGHRPGQDGSDYVESVESNKVVIATRGVGWKETACLDLDTRRIDRFEVFDYDSNGALTNRYLRKSLK